MSVAGSLDGTCRVGSGRDAACLAVRDFYFRGAVFLDRCSLGLHFGGLRRPGICSLKRPFVCHALRVFANKKTSGLQFSELASWCGIRRP